MRIIRNYDVASYYPNLMIQNGYTSRNIPNPEIFASVVNKRLLAKASDDKATANALKLVINTTYGAMLNQYNDLYDPLMGRSVCISGQLYLLELAEHLFHDIPNLRIIQLNTDGIMIEFDDSNYLSVKAIVDEWQLRTGFTIEEDRIKKIIQKDVNNYIEIQKDGSTKVKGGYLVRGISPAGAFNVNNSSCVVATAIREFFVNGKSAEETINECNDITQFQIIAKAGSKYKSAYQLIKGEKQPVQKVNRVYATANTEFGKLYKIKADGSEAQIESLPEHCMIDNDNHLTIDAVDKQFYIDLANKRINDFIGSDPDMNKTEEESHMGENKNVYQKLLDARLKFLEANVEKTGKNMHLSFKYFELSDIVPTATRIFKDVGLISVVNFSEREACLTIVNTENPEEVIVFDAPFDRVTPIVGNSGKQATNEMQALGASITYMRRYLYMIALDICESDMIDANIGTTEKESEKEKPKAAASPAQRQAMKVNLTYTDGKASDLQITGLKKKLKELKESDASATEWINQIALATKGFSVMTKAQCEQYMTDVNEKLKGMANNG